MKIFLPVLFTKKSISYLKVINKNSFKILRGELKDLLESRRKGYNCENNLAFKKEIIHYEKISQRLNKQFEKAEKRPNSKIALRLEEEWCYIKKIIREMKGLRKLIKEKRKQIKEKKMIESIKITLIENLFGVLKSFSLRQNLFHKNKKTKKII